MGKKITYYIFAGKKYYKLLEKLGMIKIKNIKLGPIYLSADKIAINFFIWIKLILIYFVFYHLLFFTFSFNNNYFVGATFIFFMGKDKTITWHIK